MNIKQRAFSQFIVLLLSCISLGYAQTVPEPTPQFAFRTDLIPPSPNAAALGTYGTIPVSLQSGLPDISIPITEVQGQQLKIPITLNYHYSGLKPSEEASWTGLGWSLDAGGVITRIIQDKIDETIPVDGQYSNINWRYTTVDSITQKFMDNAMYLFTEDTEPDLYAYNFAGYSGKFIIYKNKFYQFPYQQLTITGDPSSGFVITTPDGVQYNFNIPETTIAAHNPNFDPNNPVYVLPTSYTSSWYLNTVHSADWHDVISFIYAPADTIDQNGPATQNLSVQTLSAPQYHLSPISFPFPVRIATLRLSEITSSRMTIKFNADGGRQDVPSHYLDNIQVFNYKGDLINRFKFDMGYFSSSSGSNTTDNMRLKLNELEVGADSLQAKKYHFYYNNRSQWPSKKLAATDSWGYSNGGDIPETANIMPNTIYPSGISKAPVFLDEEAGALNKIIYPTGGASVFTFEPNLTNNGLHYFMESKQAEVDVLRPDTNTINTITGYGSFTLNVAQTVHIVTTRRPKGGATTGPTKDFTPQLILTSGSQSYSFTIASNEDNEGKVDSVALQPGQYNMEVQCDDKENYTSATVNYVSQTSNVIEGVLGPGIRIKSITNYTDPECTIVASKKQYVYKDSIGESTGVLINVPHYGGNTYQEELHQNGKITTNTYRSYSSANGNGQNLTQDMYYKKVYEQDVSNTDTLLSKSEYAVFNPLNFNGTSVFLTKKADFKRNGTSYRKIREEDYIYGRVIDSIFYGIKVYLSLKRIPMTSLLIDGVPEDSLRHYSYENYELDPSWLELKSKNTTNYYDNGDSVVITSAYVYDTHPRNKILETTTDSKGSTTVEKFKYPESYSQSFASSLTDHGIYSPILEEQTWLKRSATDSVLTNGIITQWDLSLLRPVALYGFENAVPVSSLNQETKDAEGLYLNYISDSRYKKRLTNGYVNSTGNLLWQDMTSSSTVRQINYLWGYHNNYPIAQVKDADPSAIAYTSFEDDDSSWIYSAGSIVTTDAHTGVKCYSGTLSKSGLPAGNYTVSLWGKGSGTITIGGIARNMTGSWTLYKWQLTNITSVSINSNGNLVDEVRLVPANALMTSYTYDPEVGVTSINDTRDIPQFYDYDKMKRLEDIKDKDGNIIKHFSYNYASQQPLWHDTGVTQCVQNNGVNTGEEQMQQQDINPLSATFGQYQWRSMGITGGCPVPVMVYVLMTQASSYTSSVNGYTHTFKTYSFKTYSDANCTIPLNVTTDLVVNYQINSTIVFNDTTKANSYTTTPETITVTAGTGSATTAGIDVSGCSGSGTSGSCTTSSVILDSGSGYTPESPQP